MPVQIRLVILVVLLVATISASALAVAQTDGPDPDSPIQLPTAATDDDEAAESPTEVDDGTPTVRFDPTSVATPTRAASPGAEASPVPRDATPVAGPVEADLAAMTLDSSTIPHDFVLIGEGYAPIELLADSFLGLIDEEELLATGISGFYQSSYINTQSGDTLRTYVISYETVEGVSAGFALLENEEMLVPNGAFEDLPGLDGVGEEPAEITTGYIENGDGTRTGSYDVTFRIDRYQVGAAMETRDGSEPDGDVVDELARDLAERVADVIAGEGVSGVVDGLPEQLIQIDGPVVYEGYQSAEETILTDQTGELTDGYLSGYYRAASYSTSPTSILPYVTIGVNRFASEGEAQNAMSAPEAMMPVFPDLGELSSLTIDGQDPLDIDGADEVIALSFTSPQGDGVEDSVRVFIRADATLISIDVQGMASTMEALVVAVELAELQVACTVDGLCDVTGSLDLKGSV